LTSRSAEPISLTVSRWLPRGSRGPVPRNGEVSFWFSSQGGLPEPREALGGPRSVDIAVVGAGLTGLWAAYYLKIADPSLEIAVLEREFAGFGASGRNGGWATGFFAGPARRYEARSGVARMDALRRAMFETLDELEEVLEKEAIEADYVKGGWLSVALNPAQDEHLARQMRAAEAAGIEPGDMELLTPAEARTRVHVTGGRSAVFSPHVARLHPVKLVRGLAFAVERLGVSIYESTPVTEIAPHRAVTPVGTVEARWVVRATEAYTAALPGLRRLLTPINSSMIVTEPLPATFWDEVGWSGYEAISDAAHVYVYLQRTADDRIAIGGRGVPYRFGSATDRAGETPLRTVAQLEKKLRGLFPLPTGTAIDHAWSGVIGVPRDWCVTVDADPQTGLAWAGGYVGQGVAAANLAGRILRDLILGRESDLTTLPWVGRRSRRWEPEPIRFASIRGIYALYRRADAHEARVGRPSWLGRTTDRISGRH